MISDSGLLLWDHPIGLCHNVRHIASAGANNNNIY